jgi:hypothetical protein
MGEEKKSAPDVQDRELSDADVQYLRNVADKSLFDTFGIIVSDKCSNN